MLTGNLRLNCIVLGTDGILSEARWLLDLGLSPNSNSATQAIGYRHVLMLARMCQLENKIVAVGEPSYRTRRSRIKRVREGFENSLEGRIELIDGYARTSSMIEIEVEMDSDVLAAESARTAETMSEQIQQIMELENLEEKWRFQAEANDEAERLLSSQPMLSPAEEINMNDL
ncbi:hypothetical protein SLEP1_g40349 [Rubroshorea leprosula]|uniref:Uncharacterized protein n=1 Tax=Rubroshorea leprosula TaxID=152421 RepID=A0AAV5L3Z4_9ROSI|nr:hypothetical protein SLEP1_g40349 [Rubroshorea leprosula]